MYKPISLLLFTTLFLLGCGKIETKVEVDYLEPPAQTGMVAIQMAGVWRITKIDYMESTTSAAGVQNYLTNPTLHTYKTMAPLFVGYTMVLDDHGFVLANGVSMEKRDPAAYGYSVYQHANEANGFYAFFHHYSIAHKNPPLGEVYLMRIALGAMAQDRMVGVVSFDTGKEIHPDIPQDGMFQIYLTRL